jgi:hypothetical protein
MSSVFGCRGAVGSGDSSWVIAGKCYQRSAIKTLVLYRRCTFVSYNYRVSDLYFYIRNIKEHSLNSYREQRCNVCTTPISSLPATLYELT